MVKALVAVAEQLGLAVVAEGIERQAQLDAVRELGIPIGQGWFLGVPQRVAAFVTGRGDTRSCGAARPAPEDPRLRTASARRAGSRRW